MAESERCGRGCRGGWSQVMILCRLGGRRWLGGGDVGRRWRRQHSHLVGPARCHRRHRRRLAGAAAAAAVQPSSHGRRVVDRSPATPAAATAVLGLLIAPAAVRRRPGTAGSGSGRHRRQRAADGQRLTSVGTERVMLLILRLIVNNTF